MDGVTDSTSLHELAVWCLLYAVDAVICILLALFVRKFNPSNALVYDLLSVSSFFYAFNMLLFVYLECSFV